MRFDEYDLDNTASVLMEINPSARRAYKNIEDLKDFMRSMAYQYLLGKSTTFFGTLGFYLTSYKSSVDSETEVRATLSPYMVKRYLEKKEYA